MIEVVEKKCVLLIGSSRSNHLQKYYDLVRCKDFDVIVISDEVTNIPCKLEFVLRFGFKHPATILKIRKIIKNYKPNVVHAHQINVYSIYAVFAALGLNTKIVLTAWGSDILRLKEKGIVLRWLVKYCIKNANAISADSINVAKEIRELIDQKNCPPIEIALWGIENESFCSGEIKKEKLVYSNRLWEDNYNIDQIIKGFYKLYVTDSSWQLVIAGRGSLEGRLRKLVLDLGLTSAVHFVGWLENQQNINYYKRSIIFVSIPKSDATSISLIEALKYECIPFVSNISANLEHISHGVNGIVVDLDHSEVNYTSYKDIDRARMLKYNSHQAKRYSNDANRAIFHKLYFS